MNPPPHLTPSDIFAASLPTSASVVSWMAGFNAIATGVSIMLGIAYLLWKWRKEAKRRETNAPFPVNHAQ